MSQELNLRPAAEIIDDMFAPYRKRIAALEAENAELRRDAERYRFLRGSDPDSDYPYVAMYCVNSWGYRFDAMLTGQDADAAIDAAMKENDNG